MFKKSLLICMVFVNSLYAQPFDYKLTPIKVSENIWCFFGLLEAPNEKNAGAMSNSCYIKTKDSYVVFDSGPSYEYAKQSYEAMSKIEKLPVKTVIISHDHDDHWLGNSYYKDEFKSQLIGPESINLNFKDTDKTRMHQVLPKNAIKGTKIIKIDRFIKKLTTIKIGGEEFEIVPIGTKAHTAEDIFLYMPKRKVIFCGDLAMNGRITSNRHGSLLGQIKAIKMMRERDWKVCVTGHGFDYSKNAMDESDKYFNELKSEIDKAIDNDVELNEIVKKVKMQEFKDKAMYKDTHGRNVSDAFLEIELSE